MPDPQIYAAISKYRAALIKAEAASAERLVSAYAGIFTKLQDDIRALEADILALGENPTRGQVIRLTRYKALLKQTVEQMDRYAVTLETEVSVLRQKAIADALAQNKTLVQAALPNLPPSVQAQILTNFNRLNPQAIETLLGALSKNSPLTKLLNGYGEAAAGQIADVILQGVSLGYNPVKTARLITQAMGGNLTRALTIARTEQLRAYRSANLANYAANGDVVKGWKWSATQDDVTCLACLALDGQEFELSQSYMPAHPNCILPDNEIVIPDLVGATQSFYVGRAIEMRLRGGRGITVTENHPILTPRGWIRAQSLGEGDNVFVALDAKRIAAGINPDYQYAPTAIQKIFSAFVEAGSVTAGTVKVPAENFYGDARRFDGEVNVVYVNRFLWNDRHATRAQALAQNDFHGGCVADVTLFGNSAFDLFGVRDNAPFSGAMRCDVLTGAGFGTHARPLDTLGFGLRTGHNPGSQQAATKRAPINSDLAREFVFRFAQDIALDEVVEIRHFDYSGHVYDLQSEFYQLYICNSVIVKNCRCSPTPVTVTYRDLGLDVDDLPPRETASEWFDTLPESEQRKYFSAAGWRAYQDGAVSLTDFIGVQHSDVWGDAYVEKSLKDILGENAKRYYA